MTTSLPSQDEALDMYQRLLAGDPVAPSDLACAYLDYLVDELCRFNPGVDEHCCCDAAEAAILSLIHNPASYNPKRGRLDAYLRMSARGDLKNILAKERRHRARLAAWGAVELSPDFGKWVGDAEANPADIVESQETIMEYAKARRHVPDAVTAELTPGEARVLDLMRVREHKTPIFAQALGITHLPADQQRREVKRVKDRLQKRIERAEERHV